MLNRDYTRGPLADLDLREFLIVRDGGNKCAYCDAVGVPLELDHVVPRCQGGSDRASNRVLACRTCNERKGSHPLSVFVKDPARLARIRRSLQKSLRDAAVISSTTPALIRGLREMGFEVHESHGWQTKQNRLSSGLPKSHPHDALAAGAVDRVVSYPTTVTIAVAVGRGKYQRALSDKYGFARAHRPRQAIFFGFRTGDIVRAVVPRGKHMGTHVGRVAVRESGSFNITTSAGVLQGIGHQHLSLLRRADGWNYFQRADAQPTARAR